MKYSDVLAEWLVELGYTHCFFVAGGHAMHLVESCSRRLIAIPVVHEVAAGIAAEYFNEVQLGGKAFALVTSGPGLTNMVTALAGAYLESRELLVIGGQVKTTDLARGQVRQRGIQEIDGVALTATITQRALRMDAPLDRATFAATVDPGRDGRRGPVFLEVPLDVQAAPFDEAVLSDAVLEKATDTVACSNAGAAAPDLSSLRERLLRARRPVLLIGGGVDRATATALLPRLATLGIPLMSTWNGMDRIPAEHPLYCGRPNTWGQRAANVLLQQADLVVALGTRLGLQQTGFCWREFVPVGDVVQVDCDARELAKGHPALAEAICADANVVLRAISDLRLPCCCAWRSFCREVRAELPLVEEVNQTADGYLSPYAFVETLSALATGDDLVVPCSSGGAFTVMMQVFAQKAGQRVVTNKALAAMGYGLSGAMGAAVAGRGRRTILVEGDGGFLQNLQELGTVAANQLKVKIFLFDNNGYASIRMTQQSYFQGHIVGCDPSTGLGLPDWSRLFAAYGVALFRCEDGFEQDPGFLEAFDRPGPAAFLVPIDPQQTYYPKINSRMTATGMESDPLHAMFPPLSASTRKKVFRHLPDAVDEARAAS